MRSLFALGLAVAAFAAVGSVRANELVVLDAKGVELAAGAKIDGSAKLTLPAGARLTLVAADGRLVVVKTDGEILLMQPDPAAMRIVARSRPFGARLAGAVRAPPAIAGGRLYLRDDRRVLCLEVGR